MSAGEDWQSQKFRQSVVQKISELLQQTGQDQGKNAAAMENALFKKSRTKEDYLAMVAKVYMHFKESAQRRPQPPPPNAEMGQQNMMQDPLNALQNLASQGNRNPQMMSMPSGMNPNQMSGPGGQVPASSLLQTLNQQRPGQQMQQMQGIRGQLPMGAGSVGGPGQGPNVGGPNQQMVSQMGGNIQMNVMGSGQQGQLIGNAQQLANMQGQMSQMGPGGPVNSGGSSGGPGPTGPGSAGPNQMQINPSQAGPGNAMNMQQMQQMNQNQMTMGMGHPQLNQMMNARMNQSGPMNVGPNIPGQGMQGMPANIQHPSNVGGMPPGQMGTSGQQGNLNQMLNMPPNLQQKANMPMPQSGQMFPGNRGVPGQQQFLRQSPSPSTVPSPAGMSAQQQQQLQQQQQQQQIQQQQQQQQQQQGGPNQAQSAQLPTPQMIPSPALVPTSSPQMTSLMQGNQRNLRQSPSAPLNTPGQVAANSPFNPQEEHLYREKYKQLTKYIEPLKRMVAKIGNDGSNTDKITKMSKLLEILSNPAQRVPLETLLKCEKALERLDFSSFPSAQFVKSSNPLLEVVSTTLQSPIANHTLHRTFRPALEQLFGSDICAPMPAKRQHIEERSNGEFEIPHVLQGEVARLDQKFKVTLDPAVQPNSKLIRLICFLDDERLPNVPPLKIDIGEEYPLTSPDYFLNKAEYAATPFLQTTRDALIARIAMLPKRHSLTHILDSWEMAVRQACSPNIKPIQPSEIACGQ